MKVRIFFTMLFFSMFELLIPFVYLDSLVYVENIFLPCVVTLGQVSGAESMEEEKQRPSDEVSGAEYRDEEKQRPTEKLKSDGDLRLNIMESESLEAAVLDLEELIVRFEWMKGMLAPTSSEKSSWVYVDYRPSSSRI